MKVRFGLKFKLSLVLPVVAMMSAAQPHAARQSVEREASSLVVSANDNRKPAGMFVDGALHLTLRAGMGSWRPEGDDGPALQVEAFGEADGPLHVPGPLIRVREGVEIFVDVRNELEVPMQIHGLCTRNGTACPPLDLPTGGARQIRFASGTAGTYHYWATTTGLPLTLRSVDAQLSGAFIVDPASGHPEPDRVLVITEWTSLTRAQLADIVAQPDPGARFLALKPSVLFAVNGHSWPHTEQFTYDLGEPVHWRVLNLSTQPHPMHLHGFYFEIQRQGNGLRDEPIPESHRTKVVTQLMTPGATIGVLWKPERAGRWLFHCHTMVHVSPTLHVDGSPKSYEGHDSAAHAGAGMKGLVVGIIVREPSGPGDPAPEAARARELTLELRTEPGRFGDAPAFGFLLSESWDPIPAGPVPIPGPPLVLNRGEPVAITLVNRLPEATSIHWHGMELESYYDGVHGWGGSGTRATPMIEPGDSFVVRFAPPRAGTFIYHTHLHDNRQLTSGLYGALLVVEPDQPYAPEIDHVFVLGRGGPALDAPLVINGQSAPQVVWKAGTRHRIRLINITPNDIVAVSLRTEATPVTWRPLAKDGAELPAPRSTPGSAALIIGVGETYDFEYEAPPGRQALWLEVRSSGGKWLAQGRVVFR
jgi:FtsP/CotA-like multicopper oxidase with cupredoxin domain